MKRKTTVYLEDGLLRALKVAAARSGRREHRQHVQADSFRVANASDVL